MKVEYKTRTTTNRVYVAFDGKEFVSAEECKKYEEEKQFFDNINCRFNDMILYSSDGEDMFVPYCTEDEEVVIVIPKDESDIAFLNMIMIHHNGENSKLFCSEHINKHIMIEYNNWFDEGIMTADWFGWETVDEHIQAFTKAMQTAVKCADELQIMKNDIKLKQKKS